MTPLATWLLSTFGPPLLRVLVRLFAGTLGKVAESAQEVVAELERTDLDGPAKRAAAIARLRAEFGEVATHVLNLAVELAVAALREASGDRPPS